MRGSSLGVKALSLLMVAAVVLTVAPLTVGFAATDVASNSAEVLIDRHPNRPTEIVGPLYITDGEIEFVPSVTSPYAWVDVNGWLKYRAYAGISYEYYDELVDGRLHKPLISSTNIGGISFVYESHNKYLGGPAWRAREGFWVLGTVRKYLNADTTAFSTGTYKAKLGGGPGYIPSAYPLSAWLYVD